ncbi:7410_t:CDS:1, partial [Racocetra fulgida]
NHLNYLEKFKSLFSEQYEQEINRLTNTSITQQLRTSNAYREIIKQILTNLNNIELYELILIPRKKNSNNRSTQFTNA